MSFANVGILELLRHDDRPTFVLGQSTSGVQDVVFQNPAFQTFLAEYADISTFLSWSQALRVDSKEEEWKFAGRPWTSTFVGSAWLVVYCAHTKHAQHKVPLQSQKPKTLTWDLLALEPNEGPAMLDWTRFDVSDISSHMQLIKDFDWASTSLGPIKEWPDRLSSLVVSICTNPDPRIIIWGEELIMIYNEACARRIGEKHPFAMGKCAKEAYSEIWPETLDLLKPALLEGKAVKKMKQLSFQERNNMLEETYWNIVMFPIIGPDGHAIGAIDSLTELTEVVISQRRREVVEKLNETITASGTVSDIWYRCLKSLEQYPEDVPFALVYCNDDDASSATSNSWSSVSRKYHLQGSLGFDPDNPAIPKTFDLSEPRSSYGLARACKDGSLGRETVILRRRDDTLPPELAHGIEGRGWGDAIETVCVMPVSLGTYGALAFLVVGLNPRRPFNDESLKFAHSMRDVLAKASSALSQQKFEEIHDSLSSQLRISTLRASRNEEKFTRMAESAPVGICTFRPDGKPLYINDKYLELVGVTREYDWRRLWDTDASWWKEINPADIERITTAWQSLLDKSRSSVTVEYRMSKPWVSKDKTTGSELTGETWLMNNAQAELDESGNVLYVHAWLMNVSSQHYTESLLGQRLQEALETKRASENFIDLVSHELRNPLSAILQSADGIQSVLEESGISGKVIDGVLDSIQTITICAEHQKCIVDDILCLSKLDSQLLILSPEKVHPPQLVQRVLKMYNAELQKASIAAKFHIEQSYYDTLASHDTVMLDPSRLLQVIINLMTNAIKFTQYSEERRLTVSLGASFDQPTGAHHKLAYIQPRSRRERSASLSAEWGQGKDVWLQFAVQDTGRGLSEDEISLLFQRFSQASPKTYKQYGGSGLGLFISRELTELHGGQIGVSSGGIGKGSTFAFYVRARQCNRRGPSTPESPIAKQNVWATPMPGAGAPLLDFKVLSGSMPDSPVSSSPLMPSTKPSLARQPSTGQLHLHVLVVEDNLINQKVMAQQLRRQNCTVHIANHGVECLDFLATTMFTSTPSSIPLDVVLMDLEMPVMDGLTCIREIRNKQRKGEFGAHVPVIAVTANARGEQITTARDVGVDEVVTKPCRIADLAKVMRELVERVGNRGNVLDGDVDGVSV